MDFLSIEFCKPTNKKRMKTNHRRPFCTPKPILVPTVFVPLDQRSENERLWENTTVKCQACANGYIFGSQQPRPRGSLLSCAGKIGTPGQVQRHSGFEWLCKHNRLRPEPIRFVRLDSEHAQSEGKSVNRGLPELDLARGRDPRC